ncbi:MAG TPA: hypothetical protein VIL74_20790 [Pyrinomonadaceae bacterium]|jgi:Arc/MetJ-type ribon-helix-helix transcriptional regulator
MGKQQSKIEMVSHHLRLPKPMNEWLSEYSTKNNFSSEMDAVRSILREHQQKEIKQSSRLKLAA